ncbi:histone acetyltransferase HAC1-like protein isoform X3, partial [Tanacetum coccineum]
ELQTYIKQEVQDANLRQIVSSHSSLPDLLVSNSFCQPESYMNLAYDLYNNHASVNICNPILYGGSAYNEYSQNVACGGMNLISPLGVTHTDLDIITSPEQVSSITACSYGDVISDTEAFDSRTPTYSFQQQPFHNNQYTSFTENKRNAYNMDSTLLLADDVQSPYSNSCNMLQNDSLQSKCNTQISHQIQIPVSQQASVLFNDQLDLQQHVDLEGSRDAFNFRVLNAYVCYKDMPADLRREVPFEVYMHEAECKADVCKCHLYLELSSHFDKCNALNCDICGPARPGNFRLDSRKRKIDQSEATNNVDPNSIGTHVDALPTKYPKLESSIVAEHAASLNRHDDDDDAMVDDMSNSNDLYGEQKLTGLNQSNNVSLKGRTSDALIENDVLNLAPDNADESGLQPVTTSGAMVDCDSVLELKTEINGFNLAPDVDESGLTLKKPETPSHSLVNGDSVSESKTEINALTPKKPETPGGSLVNCDPMLESNAINGLNSAPDADELGLTLKKPETTSGSLVNCDSVMKSKTEINGLDSTQDADELGLRPKKPGTPSGSLVNCDSVMKSNTEINGLDSTPDADELGLTPKKPETPSGSLVNCDSVLESKTEISGLNPAPDANELDLTLKKPETPSGSLVNCDSAINGLNPAPDANILDLTSKQPETISGSLVRCDSALLESKNTEIEVTSLTDNDSGLEPEKIKIQSVSLADFFTADQIKQHLLSFTSQKDASGNRPPSNGHNTCQVCSMEKLAFAPAPIYCSSCEIRIKRNVGYYRSANEMGVRHCFCMSCYRGSHGNNILLRGFSIPKAHLQKAKNDEEKEDSWVQCDKCQCWQHRTCGLYNDEKDVEGKAEYICPKCYLEEIESGTRVPLPQATASEAKDLPKTNLSDHIEERLFKRLNQEREEMSKISGMEPSEIPAAEGLVVRVVVSVEKHLEVMQKFIDILHGEDYPSGFSYRSKEFGSECGGPNQRCVYISYLDSVKYFRPERKSVTGESLRTVVYHEILIGYLEYCKNRGFATCYIWACPLIKGEDYIFYCHPETQRTPKQDKLRQWYKLMLKKATEDHVVVDYTNIYNHFFVPSGEANSKITAARLPYFDGDYWSGAAENIVRKLEVEESVGGGLQSKLPNKRILKAMGQDKVDVAMKDVLVMQKLGQTILPVKENFMIVHLQHKCTHCHEVILSGSRWFCSQCKKIQLCSRCFNADKNYSVSKMHTCQSGETNLFSEVVVNNVTLDTTDKDDVFVNSFFETRDAFLNKCQKSHFQFDTLSRAKYSSMMILYHLIYKPPIKPTCAACLVDVVVERCWQCETCAKYYLCEACYKMRLGAYHPHRLCPPSIELVGGSKSEQLQKQKSLALKAVLDTLMHASQCDVTTCSYKDCITMRRLFYHAKRCSIRVRGGCNFCQRVWRILKEHSQICTDSDCKIPRCMDIKKFKEQTRAAHNTNEHVANTTNQQANMKNQQELPEVHIG